MNRKGISSALGLVHPITLSHGKNAEVWDDTGKRYIDFIGGIGVLNLGHCHPQIVAAIQHQASQLTHYAFNAAEHGPYKQLMARLVDFVPISGELAGMLTNCGAESTENALKVARIKTGRTGVIAFDGGFHGRTLAAVNLNGKVAPYKKGLGPLPGPVYHLPYPSPNNGVSAQDTQAALKRLIEVEVDVNNIAAVIVEPVIGEGGFLLLDKEFATYLREFCTQNGIALIFDEIQSGFGRTGTPFAFTHLGVEPDLLLLAKSIAGGMPLGAVIGKAEWMNYPPVGSLGGTYSGNPVACAAALATLDIMSGSEVWESARYYAQTIEKTHQRWMNEKITPWLGNLTGIGAMRGIEFKHAERGYGTEVVAHILKSAREKGLLLMPSGKYRHIIRLLTPITIEPQLLNEGLTIFESVLRETNQL
ncbi:2-aminoadipate transaminase [Pelistega europaea]|uniref:Aspartate aminotransferase family protein n=1 Tax=Pelistega europaea TaxID=106147 RepID=A0A7Y4LAE7_9BURK|nr:aspartate aminotransferase family protein [Pelistega europaea]NOL49975.1 aspartate aminotransferase family protein [Pelistega europaea]